MTEPPPTLACRGGAAEATVARARAALAALLDGETIRLVVADPAAVEDLNRALSLAGNEVRRIEPAGEDGWAVTVRRGGFRLVTGEGLPPEIGRDVEEFQARLCDYFTGDLDPAEFKRFRLTRGVYGQRQPGVQMVRLKLPFGRITAAQLRRCGELAEAFGHGTAYITTRQDIQFHHVPLPRTPAFLYAAGEVGLTTREACGNTVRNVTACPRAGVCPDEAFDVTPHAAAVARHLLRHPLLQDLPRKFKIAFSGCERDCALTRINDLGFVAEVRERDGAFQRGFRVFVGGGLGPTPEIAPLLADWVPEEELLPLCEAVLRVFDREGNRRNRNMARLKFVLRRLGIDRLRAAVAEERAALPEIPPPADFSPPEESPPEPGPAAAPPPADPAYRRWLARSVTRQRQPGWAVVTVWCPRGAVAAAEFAALAEIAERFADGALRATPDQNLALRWVREERLPALFAALGAAGLAEPLAGSPADVVSCPGAETCRLGITRSRDLAAELAELLEREAGEEDLGGAALRVSGCPNACGHHWLGGLGFHGATLRAADGQRLPAYQLLLGGSGGDGPARLARPVGRYPARRLPEAVRRLLALFRAERAPGERFPAFAARVDVDRVRQLLADLQPPAPLAGEPLFVDFGDRRPFRLETGEGECAS